MTGETASADFPTANALQAMYGGGNDGFVSKLNAAGSALAYSTYLGGSAGDRSLGIAIDGARNAYLTGSTNSTNFPTVNPIQATHGGVTDAFVSKLNAAGSALVYSTYLGGSVLDIGVGMAVDGAGGAHVVGETGSTNFPTANALQAMKGGFSDAFVTKVNAAGSALAYSTYLGGSADEYGVGAALDGDDEAYAVGYTESTNFPTANPEQPMQGGNGDAFVTKLDAAGSALRYSTYLGGSQNETARSIAVDSGESAHVTGLTRSANFPVAAPFQATTGGGFSDVFVTRFNAAGSTHPSSSYLGGSGEDRGNGIAVGAAGDIYVTGSTDSSNFPTRNPRQGNLSGPDAFVSRIGEAPGVVPRPLSDLSAPAISRLRLSPAAFRAASRGAAIAQRRHRVRSRVTFGLSEAARVTFRVERAARGRRVGSRCRRPTSANRSRRRCIRYVLVRGSFSHAGRAGANRFRFTGRLRGRKLRPARYRLRARAVDAADNRSPLARKRFRIVRR